LIHPPLAAHFAQDVKSRFIARQNATVHTLQEITQILRTVTRKLQRNGYYCLKEKTTSSEKPEG